MAQNKNKGHRGNGEGSVYRETVERATGPTTRWVAQVMVDGKKRRKVAATEAQAKRALAEMLVSVATNEPLGDGNITVAELLSEWMAKNVENPANGKAGQTIAGRRANVKTINAMLGTKRLRALTTNDVERLMQARVDAGFGDAHCRKLRTTMTAALAWAVSRKLIGHNVASVAEFPANMPRPQKGPALNGNQARRFLEAVGDTPAVSALWVTMIYTGCRVGEAMALSWEDIDFDAGTINIVHGLKKSATGVPSIGSTKNAHSVRWVAAPEPVLAALRSHRVRQDGDRLRAASWWEGDGHNLVFTTASGRPWNPSNLRREYRKVLHAAGLDRDWTPTALRRSATTLMSESGVPLEVIADQLGHRDTRMVSLHYRNTNGRVRIAAHAVAAMLEGTGS